MMSFLAFLSWVSRNLMVTMIVMLIAYRLLRWPAAAGPERHEDVGGAARPNNRGTATQTEPLRRDEVDEGEGIEDCLGRGRL